MNWEVFVARAHKPPQLRVFVGGQARLTTGALDLLGNPSFIQLLFDPEAGLIGIRSAKAEDAGAQKLNASGGFSAKSFFTHYGIDIQTRRRFVAVLKGDVLVVDPSKPVDAVKS